MWYNIVKPKGKILRSRFLEIKRYFLVLLVSRSIVPGLTVSWLKLTELWEKISQNEIEKFLFPLFTFPVLFLANRSQGKKDDLCSAEITGKLITQDALFLFMFFYSRSNLHVNIYYIGLKKKSLVASTLFNFSNRFDRVISCIKDVIYSMNRDVTRFEQFHD